MSNRLLHFHSDFVPLCCLDTDWVSHLPLDDVASARPLVAYVVQVLIKWSIVCVTIILFIVAA